MTIASDVPKLNSTECHSRFLFEHRIPFPLPPATLKIVFLCFVLIVIHITRAHLFYPQALSLQGMLHNKNNTLQEINEYLRASWGIDPR